MVSFAGLFDCLIHYSLAFQTKKQDKKLADCGKFYPSLVLVPFCKLSAAPHTFMVRDWGVTENDSFEPVEHQSMSFC